MLDTGSLSVLTVFAVDFTLIVQSHPEHPQLDLGYHGERVNPLGLTVTPPVLPQDAEEE